MFINIWYKILSWFSSIPKKKYFLENTLTHHGILKPRTEEEIKREPILYQCSYDHALRYGGPITKEVLTQLPHGDCLVDTRVHMLMPGWYPAIIGFHLDFVPRELPNSQPNLEKTHNQIHYMATIGDSSIPEFVIEPLEVSIDESGKTNVYTQLNEHVEKINPRLMKATPNNIWKFSSHDVHRATAATKAGWRYFIRVSYNTGVEPKNTKRTQVQVYLPEGYKSW